MHELLCTYDVISIIFQELYAENPGPKNASLAALALTCKSFQGIALEIIWHTQTTLVPLIKTLPSSQWRETPPKGFDREFALAHPPRKEDMERLSFYLDRIRRINYLPCVWHKEHDTPTDLKIIRTLWQHYADKSKPLFPNLTRIEFADSKHAFPCLDIFLKTPFISLSLGWSTRSPPSTIYGIISSHAPNMQELDVGLPDDFLDERPNQDFSKLICQMEALRALACGSNRLAGCNALRHLATLTCLRKLQLFDSSWDVLSAMADSKASIFPAMQELTMREGNLSTFPAFVRCMQPLQLQSLHLKCFGTSKGRPTAEDIFDTLHALAKHAQDQRDLCHLRIKSIWNKIPSIASDAVITLSTIGPALSFRNLTVFELDFPCKFHFGDPDVREMVDAWPRLRRLQLGPLFGWHTRPGTTLISLLHLVKGCPELEYIALSFDASGTIPEVAPNPSWANRAIDYLHVGNSCLSVVPVADISGVVEFLRRVFPNIKGVGGGWLYKSVRLGLGLDIADVHAWGLVMHGLSR